MKAIVTALDMVTDLKVISSPQLFVLDNQTAKLEVGDEIPVTTRTLATPLAAGADFATSNSVEYRQTGTILEVTPRVNAGGLVTMEIAQEVSAPVTSPVSTRSDNPDPDHQHAQGRDDRVGAGRRDGGAGRSDNGQAGEHLESGVPFLSRLPLIGWLFGVKADNAQRTELLVLITPRVVSNTDQARQVTQELRSRLRTIAPLEQRLRGG